VQEYNESKEYQRDAQEGEENVVTAQDLARIFKQADKWTKYHIPESHTIWNVWIDFELDKLAAQVQQNFCLLCRGPRGLQENLTLFFNLLLNRLFFNRTQYRELPISFFPMHA
jgi:hypothetical protein